MPKPIGQNKETSLSGKKKKILLSQNHFQQMKVKQFKKITVSEEKNAYFRKVRDKEKWLNTLQKDRKLEGGYLHNISFEIEKMIKNRTFSGQDL